MTSRLDKQVDTMKHKDDDNRTSTQRGKASEIAGTAPTEQQEPDRSTAHRPATDTNDGRQVHLPEEQRNKK
jgi:hypothetical protein